MAKYSFDHAYVGPKGVHLSCRTKLTREGSIKEGPGTIHPGRRIYGRQYDPSKSETKNDKGNQLPITKSRNPMRKGKLAKTSARLNARLIDHQATVNNLGSQWVEGCYKKPGSMQN